MNDIESKLSYPPLTQHGRQTWVQTDRAAHQAWGRLCVTSPRAAAVMHHLLAHMDTQTAVVASHAVLAQLTGLSPSTIKRAIVDLKAGQWVQVIQLGGKGGALAFVVNSRVGWATDRKHLHMAAFSAHVLAVGNEQESGYLDPLPPLQRIPTLRPGELQLPTGQGMDPPAQPALDGLEPDLPSIQAQLEARGQQRLAIDPETGEILT